MYELRFVTFREVRSALLPMKEPVVNRLDLDYSLFNREFEEVMDGWEPVSFQLTHTDGEHVYITVMFRSRLEVPDALGPH